MFGAKIDYKKKIGLLSEQWKEILLHYITDDSDDFQKKVLLELFNDKITSNELNHTIWEFTCHIMRELSGSENLGLFSEENLPNKLAEQAFKKALLASNMKEDKEYLIGGIAIWNLFLSQSAGGVYPDHNYPQFVNHVLKIAHNYLTGSTINKTDFENACSAFKILAIKWAEMSSVLTATPNMNRNPF